MLSIIQRVKHANITVDGVSVADIQTGILALVCVETDDTDTQLNKMADKILKYRIFEDGEGKMNLSVNYIQGGIIIAPQFTLAANTNKGNRPSFSNGCPPEIATKKFDRFKEIFKTKYDNIQYGIFGADMQISLLNDGPVTFSFKV
ncbi:hypothetical protein EGW08_023158 [Elysia chlorotica]|uniref:D-aminoacyl-tRNA deacylase n=1 Tax=Elysia chlorotica TaxID=188477 RepID=A0A3S1AV25_ELYCH|nr:hypothetical protein EGW08_023158 [Elysia chlorotica]